MTISYCEKKNKEMLTYYHIDSLGLYELPFIRESAGDGYDATVIDCTSLNGNQGRSKKIRIRAADNDSMNVVLNFWFGSTRAEVEDAILNGTPAQLVTFASIDTEFAIETEYFAVDYSYSLMQQNVSVQNFILDITIT